MGSRTPRYVGARIYALLLYLYPASFRREYGESMLQLFSDQHRSASGRGGHVMLWIKILRDLLLSVPTAHANGPRATPASKRALLTVLVILLLVFVVNGVILPSWISTTPIGDVAEVVPPTALPDAHRSAALAAGIVSTLLAFGVFVFALRQRNVWNGAAAFLAGAALAVMTLAMNPWLWQPLDGHPAALAWALGVWPLAAISWVALRAASRRDEPAG